MDPITLVGFLAAVIQLIDVTSKVVNYFNDVKDAPKDRARLSREAGGLLLLFIDLRYRVEETTSMNPWFTGLRSLGGEGGPLMEFKIAMEAIADKLAPATSVGMNLKRVLRWTLDKKEIEALLSRIERLKTLVGLALQKDHFKLSLAMKEEIAVGFQEVKINRAFDKINQWLAAPLPSSNHNTAMKKRQQSTGEWFTQSKEFMEWKMGPGSFIWLHGIPGCGKTILCSTIIQDVLSNYQADPTIAVAYFYFDFNDVDKQRTEKLIRSLIVQFLAQYSPHQPESLRSAHSRSQSEQKQPTIEDMITILRQMLKSFNTTYILLDALDECTDREDLLEFIKTLMGWNIDSLHVLTTSRKENDITMSLEPLVTCQLCIQSALVDADVRVHILERLSNDPKLNKWPVDVQDEIRDALMRGAKGMFRWVICQLDSLRKCLKLDALRKALKTLPKTLDETYERILSNLDEEYEEDALKIFQWLCFSARPVHIDEMVEVLAVDLTSDSRKFRPEQRLPDPHDILTICSTLVSVTAAKKGNSTSKSQELRLAHFSVKEYLISDRLKKTSMYRFHITPLSANFSIAKICLMYLLYFESPTILTAEFDHEFPLLGYAAKFWPRHYGYITDDADRDAVDFLGYNLSESKNSCFINLLKVFCSDSAKRDVSFDLKQPRLYYMSYFGVSGVVRLLLNKEVDINAKGDFFYGSALSAASYKGHKEVVQLLLESGANINAEGRFYGLALSAASNEGHKEVVRLLLENGANVNARGGAYGNALSAASIGGRKEVVQLLLENGANVNAKGGKYGSVLSAASYRGQDEVVRLLLGNGANVNAGGGIYGSALSAASYRGREEVVRLLLENGANVNASGGDYDNALSAASICGQKEVVRLLLKKGAKVNAKGGKYGNALSAASSRGQEEVVRLLLKNRANVNAEGGKYGNALSAASFRGQEELVQLLLESGANVNARGGGYDNALSAASICGRKEVVRLLLKNGANVNGEGEIYGNALSAASYEGFEEVVQLLLENGANVNAHSGRALQKASENGQEVIMRILLKNQADVSLVFHDDDQALQEIPVDDHEAVIQLLLRGTESLPLRRKPRFLTLEEAHVFSRHKSF